MNSIKKIIAVFTAASIMVCCFAGCSEKAEPTADTTVSTTVTTTQQVVSAVDVSKSAEQEIISFTGTDKDGNTLNLVPVFDKDGKTVIAGYITSVTNKAKQLLNANQYKLLNCVVGASSADGKIVLDTDKEKNLVQIEAYSDLQGNLVCMKDTKDLNKNKNTAEFIKIMSGIDSNKVKIYMAYTTADKKYQPVTISSENSKLYMTENGKKTEVKLVNALNTAASKTVSKDANDNKKKSKTTTTKKSKTKKTSTTAPGKSYIGIKLLKNRAAECNSPNVTLSTGKVVITKGGDYKITSSTDNWHGQIEVRLKNTESAELRFEDVKITNDSENIIRIIDTSIPSDRSFIEAEAMAGTAADDAIKEVADNNKAPNVDISFPTGTKSTFETSANSYTGVIYNESKLTVKGNGSAEINSTRNANNCICSTKSITIKNVRLSLKTAQNGSTANLAESTGSAKGIYSYSNVIMESGSLNIKSNGDAIRCDSFTSKGGTTTLKSSACDGIDADDAIVLSGGTVKSIALQKSCFKVRRVNNTEKGIGKGVRAGKGDTFKITKGTVIGESKKITTVQKASTQASITCKAQKAGKGTAAAAEESKVPIKFNISGLKKSENECIKFLYSSSSVKSGKAYTVNGGKDPGTVKWVGKVGMAEITSSNTK